MKKNTSLGILMSAVVLLTPWTALAAPEAPAPQTTQDANRLDPNRTSGYIGALVGAGLPAGNFRTDTSTNVGLTVGGKLTPNFGLGAWGLYYGVNDSGTVFGLPAGTASSNFNVAGQLNAYISVFHVGVDVGVAVTSWSLAAGNLGFANSNTSLIYGPQAGFDIPLGASYPHLSIGGEVHYLFTNATNGQNNLLALAALKVWL